MNKITMKIEGMMCDKCKENIEKALQNAAQDATITVDLKSGMAEVSGEEIPAADVLQLAVEEAGYDVVQIDVE